MFVRDHLAVVSHWARDQLREGVESPDRGARLLQLIEAADALHAELSGEPAPAENVVSLAQFRRRGV